MKQCAAEENKKTGRSRFNQTSVFLSTPGLAIFDQLISGTGSLAYFPQPNRLALTQLRELRHSGLYFWVILT
jgi:hypothetical protein